MDPTTTITSPTNTSADQENNTPPHTQPIQPSSFTTTVSLKKNQNQHHHNSPPPVHAAVTYKECLRNHAASLGGRALDGCGEFMPSPTAFPSDPTFLKCAACGCHRNFHRRESTGSTTTTTISHFHLHPPPPHRCSSPSPFPPPPISTNYQHSTHTLLGLSTVVHPEDHKPAANHHHHQQLVATPTTPRPSKVEKPFGRKRFRTKFNQEQKEKMFSFSEKLGWKLHKCDEQEIEEFCREVGVGKGVLKVWMHNNKHTFGKRSATNNNISSNNISTSSNGRVRFDNNGPNINNSNDENSSSQNINESNGADFHVSVNGSSSSS